MKLPSERESTIVLLKQQNKTITSNVITRLPCNLTWVDTNELNMGKYKLRRIVVQVIGKKTNTCKIKSFRFLPATVSLHGQLLC